MAENERTDEDLREEDALVEGTDAELVKLWRVYRTAREMCADRGYEFTDEELNISLAEFKSKFMQDDGKPNRSAMNFSARPTDAMIEKYRDPKTERNPAPKSQIGTVWVEFNGDTNVGVKEFRKFIHHVVEQNFWTGVLILAGSITPSALKIVPTVKPTEIEVFTESDLLVNITRHELVPKHVMLSVEEKKALLERYRVKESQLPRIQAGDPVAKYLGLRRGQVVKIIRKSETAGRYASYRWCI